MDGGASANNLLRQFQADLLQVPVVRPNGPGEGVLATPDLFALLNTDPG